MAIANFGGQNTAFSLLCAVGAASALERRHEVAAGLWLAALMFKPQLALPVLLVIVMCYPRTLIGVGIGAVALYGAGATIAGWDGHSGGRSLESSPMPRRISDSTRGMRSPSVNSWAQPVFRCWAGRCWR